MTVEKWYRHPPPTTWGEARPADVPRFAHRIIKPHPYRTGTVAETIAEFTQPDAKRVHVGRLVFGKVVP